MKKRFLTLFLSFAALSFVACDYNNPNKGKFDNDPQSGWVYFDYETTTVVTGVSTTFNVPVYLDAPVNEDGLTVTYSVAGEGSAIALSTGEVTLEKGQLIGNIEFTIPAEGQVNCSELEITLTGTSRSNVQVGFEEGTRPYYTTHTVIIGKGINEFVGTYDTTDGYEVEVTLGEQPYELVLGGLLGQEGAETHIFVTPGDASNNAIFPNYLENFFFSDPEDGNFYVTNDFPFDGATTDNTADFVGSTYDPCSMAMTLNFVLIFGAEETNEVTPEGNDVFTAVMTKQ